MILHEKAKKKKKAISDGFSTLSVQNEPLKAAEERSLQTRAATNYSSPQRGSLCICVCEGVCVCV